MNVKIKVYDGSKYLPESKKIGEMKRDIKSFTVEEIEDCEIIRIADASQIDDYGEYLILTDWNGETTTFRNSRVDLMMY